MRTSRPLTHRVAAGALTLGLLVAACGDDEADTASTSPSTDGSASSATATSEAFPATDDAPTSAAGDDVADTTANTAAESTTDAGPESTAAEDGTSSDGGSDPLAVVAGQPFPEDRCAANEDAGTINFLTGFDFAAAASIVEVIVADAAGYYDELCLDVELLPSFSTANYPLVASGDAQFASGGSFSEVVAFAEPNDAELVAVTVDARVPIESLLTKEGQVGSLADLEGTTIGVKGKLPTSVEVMLANEGLVEGRDFDTVLLDGFDPTAHIAIDAIVGFPVWKSNEPGTLERAGIDFDLFDPADFGVNGSFGAIFTTRDFVEANPTAAEDFVRATLRGLADAIADPDAAAAAAVELINANDNPNFLSPEGEIFRWNAEAALIEATTPSGEPYAVPDAAVLQAELDDAAAVGVFGDGGAPSAVDFVADLASALHDAAGIVIWPA